jgi:hypothetical protein
VSWDLLRVLRKRRAARKRQAVKSAAAHTQATDWDWSKFNVGPYHVKVRYPAGTTAWERVDKLLESFPAGSSLEAVEAALAQHGASFAPWGDGEPGHGGAYFSRAEKTLLDGFAVPRTIEQAGALLADLTEDAALVTPEERRDPRYRALSIQFPEWDWERVIATAICAQASRRAEARRRALLDAHRNDELHAIDREWE